MATKNRNTHVFLPNSFDAKVPETTPSGNYCQWRIWFEKQFLYTENKVYRFR